MVREGHTKKNAFEKKPERAEGKSHVDTSRKWITDRKSKKHTRL